MPQKMPSLLHRRSHLSAKEDAIFVPKKMPSLSHGRCNFYVKEDGIFVPQKMPSLRTQGVNLSFLCRERGVRTWNPIGQKE